jgi:hypothetical protein
MFEESNYTTILGSVYLSVHWHLEIEMLPAIAK